MLNVSTSLMSNDFASRHKLKCSCLSSLVVEIAVPFRYFCFFDTHEPGNISNTIVFLFFLEQQYC